MPVPHAQSVCPWLLLSARPLCLALPALAGVAVRAPLRGISPPSLLPVPLHFSVTTVTVLPSTLLRSPIARIVARTCHAILLFAPHYHTLSPRLCFIRASSTSSSPSSFASCCIAKRSSLVPTICLPLPHHRSLVADSKHSLPFQTAPRASRSFPFFRLPSWSFARAMLSAAECPPCAVALRSTSRTSFCTHDRSVTPAVSSSQLSHRHYLVPIPSSSSQSPASPALLELIRFPSLHPSLQLRCRAGIRRHSSRIQCRACTPFEYLLSCHHDSPSIRSS